MLRNRIKNCFSCFYQRPISVLWCWEFLISHRILRTPILCLCPWTLWVLIEIILHTTTMCHIHTTGLIILTTYSFKEEAQQWESYKAQAIWNEVEIQGTFWNLENYLPELPYTTIEAVCLASSSGMNNKGWRDVYKGPNKSWNGYSAQRKYQKLDNRYWRDSPSEAWPSHSAWLSICHDPGMSILLLNLQCRIYF